MSYQSNITDKNNEKTTQLVTMIQEQMSINQAQMLANQMQLQVNEALTQEVKLLREQITFHQARIETLHYVQHSYCCKLCERVGDTSLKKAPVPKPLLSNSLASPSLVAETIFLKFIQKVPAYRQEKYWQQLRLDISRDNITNWHIRVEQDFLSILVERLHQELVIGRKKSLFSSSLAGAQTSGYILSVMETAEWNELNPTKYSSILI